MKKISLAIVIVFLCASGYSQKNTIPTRDSSIQEHLTDSTGLINVKDIMELNMYLKDKLLVKDYEVIMGWLNKRLEIRAAEWRKRKNLKP